MSTKRNELTAEANNHLWGARALDWANIQEGTCRPVYLDAFDSLEIGPHTRLLDVGCGAGMAAQIAAERGARVSGLDASENLLAIARERVPEGDFSRGDLERLPFPDSSFDLVTGFNSFQYAGNPSSALAEAKRVTRPGGSVVIMTWGEPKGMDAASIVAAIKPLLPVPPKGAPGPFALSEEEALRGFAVAAGLVPTAVIDVDSPWKYPDLATAIRGVMSAGVSARAIEHSSEEAVESAYSEALRPFCKADGSCWFGASFRYLVSAV